MKFKTFVLATTPLLSLATVLPAAAQLAPPTTIGLSCDGKRVTIAGTAGDDEIAGTAGDDVISALGGNDMIRAGGGDDVVCGGDGADTIWGGEADDELFGGGGDDRLWGGSGSDRLSGEEGEDTLSCGGDEGDHGDGGPGRDDFAHADDCTTHASVGRYRIAPDADDRTFIVAGCVPQSGRPPATGDGPIAGSTWTACNDLAFAKEKVEQSELVSCLDFYKNGVLRGLYISEVRNRRWESFEFSCRDLQADGTLSPEGEKSGRLVDFSKEGTEYATLVPMDRLAVGIFERQNVQFVAHENMVQVALPYASAEAVLAAGETGRHPHNLRFTDWAPAANPHHSQVNQWKCPPGMVLTGAAFGYIEKGNEKKARPVYILGECRRLLHGEWD